MSKQLFFFLIWGIVALPGVIAIWLGTEMAIFEKFFSSFLFGFIIFFGLGSIWLAWQKGCQRIKRMWRERLHYRVYVLANIRNPFNPLKKSADSGRSRRY